MSLRFLNRYSLSLSIIAGCLFLPAVGLTAPSFLSNEEKTLGILPTYSLCMKQANGDPDTSLLECEEVEFEYQDWRLNTAYRALMKELSPAEQKKLRQKERNWIKIRHTLCSRRNAKPGSLPCDLSIAARQAGVLENLLKEHRK